MEKLLETGAGSMVTLPGECHLPLPEVEQCPSGEHLVPMLCTSASNHCRSHMREVESECGFYLYFFIVSYLFICLRTICLSFSDGEFLSTFLLNF